jgi:hypothetical protein
MELLQSCSSLLEDHEPLKAAVETLSSSGVQVDQNLVLRLAVSLYRSGLNDPQRLADAVAFLSTSKLFTTGLF